MFGLCSYQRMNPWRSEETVVYYRSIHHASTSSTKASTELA